MLILSNLLPPVGGVHLPVMETLADERRLAVTVVVGDFDLHSITEQGNACIQRLIEYMRVAGLVGNVHKVDVSTIDTLGARFQNALDTAKDMEGVVFICRSAALFDAIIKRLNLGPGQDEYHRRIE